jgi:hypothetical protein
MWTALLCASPASAQQSSTVSPFGVSPGDRIERFDGERFARTELYFGTAKADGGVVTEAEFLAFLNDEITPRFPEGLTLVNALGQFQIAPLQIIREDSKLLILLYPARSRKSNNRKIEEIRNLYKDAFQQQSVLRSDRCCEEVGF